MKVKILEKCFAGTGGNLMAGEEVDLADMIARKLIARGYAEEVKRRGRPPKTDRSITTVRALEIEEDGDSV